MGTQRSETLKASCPGALRTVGMLRSLRDLSSDEPVTLKEDQKVMSNPGDRAGSLRVHPMRSFSFSVKQWIKNLSFSLDSAVSRLLGSVIVTQQDTASQTHGGHSF